MALITKEQLVELKRQAEINDRLDKIRYLNFLKSLEKIRSNRCSLKTCKCPCHRK